jgi:hypothetical protein
MARNKGTFNLSANFQVKMQEALDPRMVVEKKSDLISKEKWPYDGNTLYLYKGLLVGVAETSELYILADVSKALEPDYSGWVRIGGGSGDVPADVDTRLTIVEQSNATTLTKVEEIESKVDILNGDETVEGSVDNKIKKSLDWEAISK